MVEAVILGAGIVIGLLLSQVQLDKCACGSALIAWCKLRVAKTSTSTGVAHDTCTEANSAGSSPPVQEESVATGPLDFQRQDSHGLEHTRLESTLARLEHLCADIARTQHAAAESCGDADPVLTWDEAARLLQELNYDASHLQKQVTSTPLLRTALLLVTQPATRIWVDGVFDLTHYGHFFFCLRARQLGTQLVVGVNDGQSVLQAKGTTPILNDDERICMIESCKFVDIVERNVPYVMDSKYLQAMIDKHHLSTIAHGDDPCFDAQGNDVYAEVKRRKMYRTIDRVTGISTTELVGRMVTFVATHYQVQQETQPGGVLVLPFGGNLKRCSSDSNLQKVKSQMEDGDSDDDFQPPAMRSTSVPVKSLHKHVNVERAVKSGDLSTFLDAASEETQAAASEETQAAELEGAGQGGTDQDGPGEDQIESRWSFAASGTIFNEFLRACIRPPQEHQALCYMDGTWDLLNAGHIQTLKESRKQAQEHLGREVYLILGVHSDVEAHRHYHDWPILNMQERVLAIMAVRGVDNVIMDAPWSITDSFMAQLGIVLVLYAAEPGWDEDRRLRQERYAWPQAAGKYKEVQRPPGGLSAEKVMDRIFKQRETYESQLTKKRRKESAFYTQKFLRPLSFNSEDGDVRRRNSKSIL